MSWNTEKGLTRYEIRMCLWETNWHTIEKFLASLAESGPGAKGNEVWSISANSKLFNQTGISHYG